MQALWSIAVLALLALWLGATVVKQFTTARPAWGRWDPLQLVPTWTFFAPNPGRSDLDLYYRDIFEGERVGDWIELPLVDSRSWLSGFWHPEKRSKKILLDAVQSLLSSADRFEESPHLAKITVPYLLLLHIVMEVPRSEGVVLRQFQIRESYGRITDREPLVVLRSEAHAV